MPTMGKHRRHKANPITRGFVVLGTGGAALVLPMVGATAANAAEQATPAVTAETVVAPATATPAVAKKAGPVTYFVVAGDSLSEVADKHSLSGGWEKLYEDNREVIGDDPFLIHSGLELTIGAEAEADTSVVSASVETTTYSNDLDGWIKESLAVMARHGIPGTYDGIHRNIMRESTGNPRAINNWDSNAMAGTPSKGLLQVIDPTFRAYHVPGTSMDSYDPVANITAACNYAADRYGSIDMVNGAY